MISNPIQPFVNGSTTSPFTYEGGAVLYHFSPYDNGLSEYMGWNVAFFADDEDHALDVLRRALEHVITCEEQYEEYAKRTDKRLTRHHINMNENVLRYLQAVKTGRVKIEKAPTGQFYKIGWADNDTV